MASHGIVSGGEYYMATSNIDPAQPGNLKQQAISAHELADLFGNIPVSRKLVVIDTCDSQAMSNVLQATLANKGMTTRTAVTILGRTMGVTILAATTTDQEAVEANNLHHGLFTFALTNGLAGKAPHAANGIVDSPSIAAYVGASVPALARGMSLPVQQPTADADGRPFPVTQVR